MSDHTVILRQMCAQPLIDNIALIEHNVRFVTRMCTNVYVLASGRLIAQGRPQDVMRDKDVVVAYLGKG